MHLDIGDAAPSLHPDFWVRGTPTSEFQKGQVYVVVFWTTGNQMINRVLPRLAEIERSQKSDVHWIGVTTFGRWGAENPSDGARYRDRINQFLKDHPDGMPKNLCADDKQNSIGTLWLPTHELNQRGQSSKPSEQLSRFPFQLPYAAIVNQEGKIAWMGGPEDVESPLRKVLKERFSIADYKEKFDSEVEVRAAQHQLFRDIEHAAKIGDKILFEGLVAKLGGLKSNIVPFSINLAAGENPEFALSEIESKIGTEKEVQPLMWCNTLSIIADSSRTDATKLRAAELAVTVVGKCRPETQAFADAYVARTLSAAGRKEEALVYLNRARALVAKKDSRPDSAQFVESIGTGIR